MSQPPSSSSDTPQAPQDQPPQGPKEREGLSPLAWVLIILGGLLVLSAGACVACGVVVMNTARDFADNPARGAAELVIRANPDLEVVDSDPDAGTLTVRNKETGEEATFDFDEIAEGRFSWSTGEGEGGIDVSGEGQEGRMTVRSGDETATFGAGSTDDLPAWLPMYPDGEVDEVGMVIRDAEEVVGSFQVLTEDDVETATEVWQEALEAAGFEVALQTFSGSDTEPRSVVVAERDDPRRQVSVRVSRQDGRTHMVVQYQGAAGQ